MNQDREERIRRRAHQIWEENGKPEGSESDHWAQAMREIDDEGEGVDRSLQPDGLDEALPGGLPVGLHPGETKPDHATPSDRKPQQ